MSAINPNQPTTHPAIHLNITAAPGSSSQWSPSHSRGRPHSQRNTAAPRSPTERHRAAARTRECFQLQCQCCSWHPFLRQATPLLSGGSISSHLLRSIHVPEQIERQHPLNQETAGSWRSKLVRRDRRARSRRRSRIGWCWWEPENIMSVAFEWPIVVRERSSLHTSENTANSSLGTLSPFVSPHTLS